MHVNRISRAGVLLVRLAGGSTERLARDLGACGFAVAQVSSSEEAIVEATVQAYPLILLDISGSESSAAGAVPAEDAGVSLRTLERLRSASPASQVVVLVGRGVDLVTCCQAVTLGAAGFVHWDERQSLDRVVERLDQAYARYEADLAEGRELHSQRLFDETGIAGKSELMAKLLFHAKRASLISDAPVLITGESGTGKQLLAEAIHRMDPKRRRRPFVTVNCAAIAGTLAESALFGHRKGAFTGATENRLGCFRSAEGGTILLDEISELDKVLQPKLLRVLQESRVLPVGGDEEEGIDVRVIASCNRPLPVLVEQNEFRLDLYQRLNVIALEIPPLRKRPEDVPLLVQFFLRRYASYYPPGIESVDAEVYEVLTRSVGTGNVRELENAVRRILAFKRAGTRLELSDIPPNVLARQVSRREEADVTEALTSAATALVQGGRMNLSEILDEFEAVILREALQRLQSTHAGLADRLGLSRRTFYHKLRKHHLTTSRWTTSFDHPLK